MRLFCLFNSFGIMCCSLLIPFRVISEKLMVYFEYPRNFEGIIYFLTFYYRNPGLWTKRTRCTQDQGGHYALRTKEDTMHSGPRRTQCTHDCALSEGLTSKTTQKLSHSFIEPHRYINMHIKISICYLIFE